MLLRIDGIELQAKASADCLTHPFGQCGFGNPGAEVDGVVSFKDFEGDTVLFEALCETETA